MKYIRTKDSISLLIKSVYCYIVKDSESNFEKAIDEETLLKNYKVADTIEELCDEIVVIFPDGSKNCWCAHSTYNAKNFKEVYGIDVLEDEIYYAIWTDKGLIYVAKMNKEGDLELL